MPVPGAAPPTSTPQALLDAATTLLERDGFRAVTLRGLGVAAGVSRAAPYRHFRDKNDLLAAVALRAMQRIRAAITEGAESAGDGSGSIAGLEAVLIAYVEEGLHHPGQYRLLYGGRIDRRQHPALKAEGTAAYAVLLEGRPGWAVGRAPGGHDARRRPRRTAMGRRTRAGRPSAYRTPVQREWARRALSGSCDC